MSGNLIEFIKVFTLVFAFSGLILAGRRYMLKWDNETSEEDNPTSNDFQTRIVVTDSDVIDYDGMGNQGRFPSRSK